MNKFRTLSYQQRVLRRIRDKKEGKRKAYLQATRFKHDEQSLQRYLHNIRANSIIC